MKIKYVLLGILALVMIAFFVAQSMDDKIFNSEKVNSNNQNIKAGPESSWIYNSGDTSPPNYDLGNDNWTIEGDTIYINDSKAYISATPHTVKPSLSDSDGRYVEFEVMTKEFSGAVDVALGFDTDKLRPISAQYNSTVPFTVEESYQCEFDFNYTANYFWCYDNETDIVFEHSFDRGNLSEKIAYWDVEYNNGWRDFGGAWNSVDFNYEDTNKWWYLEDVNMVAGESRKFRVKMKDLEFRDGTSKYYLALKPSSQTFSQAVSSDNFYFLDPWVISTSGDWLTIDLTGETMANQTFTENGTWTRPPGVNSVSVLVIAGGGGAGAGRGGGGGAGGYIFEESFAVTDDVEVIIGRGGKGGNSTTGWTFGEQGHNSSFGSLVAHGGGSGESGEGDTCSTTKNGGSGGGGSRCTGPSYAAGNSTPEGQGTGGGRGHNDVASRAGGGGGGAGNNGSIGTSNTGGAGGAGLIFNGDSYYAVGGFGAGTSGGGAGENATLPGWGGNGSASAGSPGYEGGNGSTGIVIVFWNADEGLNIDLISPSNYFNKSNLTEEYFNATVTDNFKVQNVSLYIDGVLNETNTSQVNGSYVFSKIFDNGEYNWSILAFDNDSNSAQSETRILTVDAEYPTIDIETPNNTLEFNQIGELETFNVTFNDSSLDSCWYDYNGTNFTIPCVADVKYSTNFTLEENNFNLTAYVNDTVGNLQSVFVEWDYILLVYNQTFNDSVTETESSNYEISLLYDSSSWNSISAVLYFPTDSTVGTITGTGDEVTIDASRVIPAVEADGNVTFYWTIDLINATGTFSFNATAQNQSVSKVNFTICDYSEYPQLYFETYSTTDPETRINATFASAWTIRNADGGDVVLNRSYEDTTEANSSWGFCISPNSSTYTVGVDIIVDAANYTPTTHFIVDTDYSGQGDNISLYLLDDDLATLTQVKVTDQDNFVVENVYVTIQRYDVGTDTYYDVGQARTDNEGTDLVYLQWYVDWYRFVGVYDGDIVFNDGPKKVSSTPQTFQMGDVITLDYEKFRNIVYSLTYNNVTENFILTYVDPSGLTSSNCLRVIKRNVTADYVICDTCQTSSSATIYCNVANSGNGTFIANYYASGSPIYWIDQLTEIKNAQNELYQLIGNDNGTGLAILVAGIVLAMFLVSPALGVLGMILGMVLGIALGFQPLDYEAFIGIVVVGGAIMWAVKS